MRWLVPLAALLVVWLLYSELAATGFFGLRRETPPKADAPGGSGLQADLERRARLRGLPGIQRGDPGEGRIIGRVHVLVPGRGSVPLPDVEVEALAVGGAPRTDAAQHVHRRTQTNPEGAFAFEDLPALVGYALVVRRAPWREIVYRGVNVARNRTTDAGILLLGAPTIVRGEVVDAAGLPIGGARAELYPTRRREGRFDLREGLRELEGALDPLAEAETIADGSFVLADVPPGRYVLRVEAPGFATAFRDDVWVSRDERATTLSIVLDPGAGFYGRVEDETGHPVADARVIAVAISGAEGQGLDRTETRSAADGAYRLDTLISGERYFLEAWAQGRAPTGRFAIPQGMTERDLVLEPTGRVAGRVTVAGTDTPVAAAEVMLVAGNATGLSPVTAVCDDDGRYAFDAVRPGPVMLFGVDAPGHVARSFTFGGETTYRVEAGETTAIDVELEPGIEAEGRVVDPRGRPIPYATVAFLDPRHRSEGEESTLTDTDGGWSLGGLRATTYEVRVLAPGFAPLVTDEDARVEVAGPGPFRRDFVLDPGAVLHGRVLNPTGASVSGARVVVVAAGGRRVRERVQDLVAVTGATGAWRIPGVPPHTELRVEARHDAWARAVSPPQRLGPGQDQELELVLGEGAQVAGRVVDANGSSVEGARVRWGPLEGENDRAGRDAFRADQRLLPRVVRTDAAGRFLIDRLEPGRWLVKVEHEAYAPWYRRDLVVAEDATPFLHAVLEPSLDIRGRVEDRAHGRPVAGAWVYAREAGSDDDGEQDPGRVPGLASAQTDATGSYRIVGLAPNRRYEVVAWLAPGYRGAVQAREDPGVRQTDVRPGARGIDFRLEAE